MATRKARPEAPKPIPPDTVEIGEGVCPECGGHGDQPGDEPDEPCEICDGRGCVPVAV